MAYALGVDVGTSFTAAAITRRDEIPRTLTLGQRGDAVPTVIHLDADGEIRVGEAAERRGVTEPERVIREFKRRIGDSVPILAGDVEITPQDAFASMARWVVDRAEEREGEPPASVTITHPAGWGDYKLGLVRDALAGVGLADAALLPEPEAAALHYAAQERVPEGSCIGVYDLGAGTFDVALLRKAEGDAFVPVGRPDGLEQVGGADFDDAVLRHVVRSMPDAFAGLDTEDIDVRVALARLRRECTEAKEALSFDSEAAIPVVLPGTHGQVRLVRAEFEAMIADEVRRTIDTFARVVNAAGLRYDELSVILLIGGSSRIPLIAELLSAEFGRPVAVDADPKSAICLGAAASAALTAFAEAATDDGEDEDPSALAALGLAGAAAPAATAPSALHRIGSPAVLTIAAVVVAAVALGGPAASMFSLFDPASDSGGGASAASAAGAEQAAAALPAPGEAVEEGAGGADAPATPLKPGARNADDQDDGFSPLRGPSPRPAAAKDQPEKGSSPSPAPGGSTPTPATANDPSPDPTQTPSSDPSSPAGEASAPSTSAPSAPPSTGEPSAPPSTGQPSTPPSTGEPSTPPSTGEPDAPSTSDPAPPQANQPPQDSAPAPTTPAPEPEPSPSATSDTPADQPAATDPPAATP